MWAIGEIASLVVMGLAVVPRAERLAPLGAGFNLAFGALMTAYVFGADTYANDGRSRWATRGGSDHALYVVVIAVVAVCTRLFAFLAARGTKRGWIARSSLLLSGVADAVLGYVLVLAFDNN